MSIIYVLGALIIGFALGAYFKRKIWKKRSFFILVSVFLLILITIIQFVRASGHLSWDIDTNLWAQYGTFIGGVLLAVTLSYQFYSFKKQKEQSEKQFRETQLQNRFFEMIKYHRENVLEFNHIDPNSNNKRIVEGRKVFVEIYNQFIEIHKVVSRKELLKKVGINALSDYYNSANNESQNQFRSSLEYATGFSEDESIINRIQIDISYHFLFYGVLSSQEGPLKDTLIRYNPKYIKEIFDKLSAQKAFYDPKIKYFGGHLHRLGHYYRHLFQSVKLIDENPDLSFPEKYSYIKNLRAQLSTYEQIMLFIDSLTELGIQWEFGSEKNFFITKYNLIQNIPVKMLSEKISPTTFYRLIPFEDLNLKNIEKRIEFLHKIMPEEYLSIVTKE